MTDLYRVRTAFSGGLGGLGVATMYFLDVATAVAAVQTFWGTMGNLIPAGINAQVESTGDIINDVNGDLTGAWGADPVANVPGGGSANYAAPVGGMATWHTGTILDGKRLKGRTYVVPMSREYFTAGGHLDDGSVAIIAGAAAALVIAESASMVLWHRPRAAKAADGSRPAITERDGGHGLVTLGTATSFPAVLRSRRD